MAQHKNTSQAADPKPNAANDTADNQAEPSGPTVDVTAPRPRRRGGIRFGKEPVTVDPHKIGKEAWEAIEDDPVLVIRPTPEDKE